MRTHAQIFSGRGWSCVHHHVIRCSKVPVEIMDTSSSSSKAGVVGLAAGALAAAGVYHLLSSSRAAAGIAHAGAVETPVAASARHHGGAGAPSLDRFAEESRRVFAAADIASAVGAVVGVAGSLIPCEEATLFLADTDATSDGNRQLRVRLRVWGRTARLRHRGAAHTAIVGAGVVGVAAG